MILEAQSYREGGSLAMAWRRRKGAEKAEKSEVFRNQMDPIQKCDAQREYLKVTDSSDSVVY